MKMKKGMSGTGTWFKGVAQFIHYMGTKEQTFEQCGRTTNTCPFQQPDRQH